MLVLEGGLRLILSSPSWAICWQNLFILVLRVLLCCGQRHLCTLRWQGQVPLIISFLRIPLIPLSFSLPLLSPFPSPSLWLWLQSGQMPCHQTHFSSKLLDLANLQMLMILVASYYQLICTSGWSFSFASAVFLLCTKNVAVAKPYWHNHSTHDCQITSTEWFWLV